MINPRINAFVIPIRHFRSFGYTDCGYRLLFSVIDVFRTDKSNADYFRLFYSQRCRKRLGFISVFRYFSRSVILAGIGFSVIDVFYLCPIRCADDKYTFFLSVVNISAVIENHIFVELFKRRFVGFIR